MLLASERHSPADLALWAELEEADRIHGEQLARSGKWRRAVEEMQRFAAAGPSYVSVSWGKDSVVLAHLHHLSGLRLPVANVAQQGAGCDPHIRDVRDAFLRLYHDTNYHEEVVPLERIPDNGGHSPALDKGIRRLAARYGTSRYIGGIRADESGVRRIGLRHRGLSTGNTCQPLGWWTTRDVFGWLAYHDLPVHPNYAMLGGGRFDRRHIRVSTIGGPKGNQFGRDEWEREYYGDVLRRIERSSRG
jgi:phosphoadenosine phosphosulfate reductase